jgi:aspartyl-tRNA(Asn)/glutamyl-tRNA(Gln) amidotransferase subunit C
MPGIAVDIPGLQVLAFPEQAFLLHAGNNLSAPETIEFHNGIVGQERQKWQEGFLPFLLSRPFCLSGISYSLRHMSSISSDDVRRIAKLARLELSDAEVEKFAPQLTSILGYIDMLSEVDTKNVKAAAQPTGLTNVLREDVITSGEVSPDALLATSPLPITEHQIQTPSAHE